MTALNSTPYQRLADSPTVKYYTDWRAFEAYLEKPRQPTRGVVDEDLLSLMGLNADAVLGVAERGGVADLGGLEAEGLKLLELHKENLSLARKFRVAGEYTLLVEKPVGGVKSSHLEVELVDQSHLNLLLLSPERAGGLHTLTVKVELEPGSRASLAVFVFDSLQAPGFLVLHSNVPRGASLSSLILVARGLMSHVESHARTSEGGSVSVYGLLAAGPGSRVTLVTDAEQREPRSRTTVDVLGFAAGGVLAHKGLARVGKGAWGSSLVVRSRLTPLTPSSKVYAMPMLEVSSNEAVEAAHSASHAPVGDEALFYLRSRGLELHDALRLVIESSYLAQLEKLPRARQPAERLIPVLSRSLLAAPGLDA